MLPLCFRQRLAIRNLHAFHFHSPEFRELCLILKNLWSLVKFNPDLIIVTVPENIAKVINPHIIVTVHVPSLRGLPSDRSGENTKPFVSRAST